MPIKSVAQYAIVNVFVAGDNTIVPAVAGKKIRVLALVLVASGGVNSVALVSGFGPGTQLTGLMSLVADGQIILPANGFGWTETAPGEQLNFVLQLSTLVTGLLVYEEIE